MTLLLGAACWMLCEIGLRLAARLLPGRLSGASLALAGCILAATVFTCLTVCLGSVGMLTRGVLWTALLLLWVGARRLAPRPRLAGLLRRGRALLWPRRRKSMRTFGAVAAALLLLTCLVRAWSEPYFAFDSLNYHLPFTAEVARTGTIPLADDDAQAHQPKLHCMLSAGLQILSGSERIVLGGNVLYLPLLLLAIYVAARALGCRRGAALLGTLPPVLAPELLMQAAGSMADLPFCVFWFAFAACTLHGARRRDPGQALPSGAALGLALGCKSLALPFGPLALGCVGAWLVRIRRQERGRACLVFAGAMLATGTFFYLRNLALTGNPLYPMEVRAFGRELFAGEYGSTVMSEWIFAQRGRTDQPFWISFAYLLLPLVGVLRPALANALPSLAAVGLAHLLLPCLLLVAGACARRRQGLVWWCAAIPPLVLALCWFVVPYTYGRFALTAVPFAGVMLACLAGSRPGSWLAAGWLIAYGMVYDTGAGGRVLAGVALGAGVCTGLAARAARHRDRRGASRGMVGAAGVVLVVATLLFDFLVPTPIPNADTTPPLRPLRGALDFVRKEPARGDVAFTGTLLGHAFVIGTPRRALRVPLDGRVDVPFFVRAQSWRADGLPRPLTPDARMQDRFADPAAWLTALQREGIGILVIARLHDQALLGSRHDAQGFPEELAYARAAAPALTEIYRDPESVVFVVHRDRQPAAPLPPSRERREPEALSLLHEPAQLAQWYPLAAQELQKPEYARVVARAARR